ncbi:tetratricopeptide repeat protein 16 isoform X2 [Erinaceus europaeus]|uniref:Tetratricopeptide repeat protein 16 isoform X2 n=1 Tax=Erinaceus europaeus TaxID=9365 RepID=A0ABM3Y555_ERIEU|nr:tetratricopeptide repeat protein 16 isoform X2 [Erinaceus europaeus]
MADSEEDAVTLDEDHLGPIPKPWVISSPVDTLEKIFGSSKVFQIIELKPKVVTLTVPLKVGEYYTQGQQCLEQEDWETAVLFFSRALHLDSNLGQCLFEQCAFLDALNVFLQATEIQPDKPCFRYRCMACLLALKRHHDCLAFTIKEVRRDTTNPDVYILRARLYNFFQKPSLCYQDLHKALLLDPKHLQAKKLLKKMVEQSQKARWEAGILAVQGKLQHALQRINCAIDNNPLDPSFFLFRGTLYRRLQEFDTATEDFLKALDMVPESQEYIVQQTQRQLLLAYNDFAVHCYKQGAYQESVLLLNKVLKDEQHEKGLYINRGDCFFQLGNLAFAEADYKQALALSPQDEGANLRMGLLQEKLGLCEKRSRKFDRAESHFSMAIQHNPQKVQYYLYRAKIRQLLQNFFGARQDVATVLLLDPKNPKLLPLLSVLFPGMTVEAVRNSQVGRLAMLQLKRRIESNLQTNIPYSIMGQFRQRELERQKARAMWQRELPLSEALRESSFQTIQEKPAQPQQEEKPTPDPKKVMSLSESYLGKTSSLSLLGYRTTGSSDTETSSTCQEYRSPSTTTGTLSESSLLETHSSDLWYNWENSRSRKSTQNQSQSSSKIEAALDKSQRLSRTEAPQGQKQNSIRTELAWDHRKKCIRTVFTQDQREKPRRTQVALRHRLKHTRAESAREQRPSKTEVSQGLSKKPNLETAQSPRQKQKTKATQHPRGRHKFRKAKLSQGLSWGLIRSSSKTKSFYTPNWSPSNAELSQDDDQWPSQAVPAQDSTQSTLPSLSKTEVDWKPHPSLHRSLATHDQNSSPQNTKAGQDSRSNSNTAL